MPTRTMTGSPRGLRGLRAGMAAAGRGVTRTWRAKEVRSAYWKLVLAVLALTVVLDVAAIALVLVGTRRLAGTLPDLLLVAAQLVLCVVAVLVVPVAALVLVNLFAPLLAERLFIAGLRQVAPDRARALEAGEGLRFWPSAVASAGRLARHLVLSLGCLLLALVPGLGLLAPVLQLVVNARTLGWELLDPYLSLRGMRHRQQRAYVAAHRAPIVGFALPHVLPLAIPLLGPFLIGLAHASAAVLVAEVLEPDPGPVSAGGSPAA